MIPASFKSDPLSVLQGRDHKSLDTELFSYKLGENHFGLDISSYAAEPEVDEERMSFKLPFADGNRRDGVGDLLEVGGIDVSRHRSNPINLFDHGKQIVLPLGKSEDPETKEYTVQIDAVTKAADCRCFVYQGKEPLDARLVELQGQKDFAGAKSPVYEHGKFCEQLFDLWAKGFVRAGSIGYQVVKALELRPDYEKGTPQGLHLLQVLMLEASAVVLPANGDTVAKVKHMPLICGKPPSPYLIKSLEPYCSCESKSVVGFADVVQEKAWNSEHDYDDSLPYGGKYGVWKKGDKFDNFGVEWEVVKLRDKGKVVVARRIHVDSFGKEREELREFPLTAMGTVRRIKSLPDAEEKQAMTPEEQDYRSLQTADSHANGLKDLRNKYRRKAQGKPYEEGYAARLANKALVRLSSTQRKLLEEASRSARGNVSVVSVVGKGAEGGLERAGQRSSRAAAELASMGLLTLIEKHEEREVARGNHKVYYVSSYQITPTGKAALEGKSLKSLQENPHKEPERKSDWERGWKQADEDLRTSGQRNGKSLSSQERDWMKFVTLNGPGSWVREIGGPKPGWQVEMPGRQTYPKTFKSRKEAMDAVNRMYDAMREREKEGKNYHESLDSGAWWDALHRVDRASHLILMRARGLLSKMPGNAPDCKWQQLPPEVREAVREYHSDRMAHKSLRLKYRVKSSPEVEQLIADIRKHKGSAIRGSIADEIITRLREGNFSAAFTSLKKERDAQVYAPGVWDDLEKLVSQGKSLPNEDEKAEADAARLRDFQTGETVISRKVVARRNPKTGQTEAFSRTGDKLTVVEPRRNGFAALVRNGDGWEAELSATEIRRTKSVPEDKPTESLLVRTKSLKALRSKYRSPKGLKRTLRKSVPGASLVRVASKDLSDAEELATSKGLKFSRLGTDSEGLEKVKLMGPDHAIDEVAKAFGHLQGV